MPAAIALLAGVGRVERATALFQERYGPDGAHLPVHQEAIKQITAGQLDHLTVALDGATADILAVLAPNGRRCALVAVADSAPQDPGDRANPLLDEPLDNSPAIVWLKDLDGRYMRVNRRYTDALGCDADSVCGRTDAELSPSQSIEAARMRADDLVPHEPLDLEYTVAPFDSRPAFAVLRFALRDDGGEPIAVCGVAAPLPEAHVARAECERLMKIERWARLDVLAIRDELLSEWDLEPAAATLDDELGQLVTAGEPLTDDQRRSEAYAAEITELRQALVDAQARLVDLEREREDERSRAELLRTRAAEAAAAGRSAEETLRSDLAGARDELASVKEQLAGVQQQLAAAREELAGARNAAEEALARAAGAEAELESERAAAEVLRAELKTAHEATEQERRAASEAAAGAADRDQLERERRRAEEAQAALNAERARSERAAAEARSALSELREALEVARSQAAASTAELEAERQAVEQLGAELVAIREELQRAERELSQRPTSEELAQQRARAEEAEAAAGRAADEASAAVAALEEERRTAQSLRDQLAQAHTAAEASLAELAAERDRERARAAAAETEAREQRQMADDLQAELSASRERLEQLQAAAEAAAAQTAAAQAANDQVVGAQAAGPVWNATSQRALSAALAGVSDLTGALKLAARSLGREGGWDLAVAWCPEDRRGPMKCITVWTADPAELGRLESAVWQHQLTVSGTEFGRAARRPSPTCLLELQAAEDALVRAAAEQGMGSALLVPVRNNDETVAMIGLFGRTSTPPDPEVMLFVEGVALQVGALGHLLTLAATPRWHFGRL